IAEPSQDEIHRCPLALFLRTGPLLRPRCGTFGGWSRDCDFRQIKDDMPMQTVLCGIAHISQNPADSSPVPISLSALSDRVSEQFRPASVETLRDHSVRHEHYLSLLKALCTRSADLQLYHASSNV